MSIICKDNQSDNPKQAVRIAFNDELSIDNFLSLFKRFSKQI